MRCSGSGFLAIIAGLCLITARLGSAEMLLTVHVDQILRRDADRALGINLNYIRDADVNRPAGSRPLAAALDDLGVRWLRYPGGEKSDYHRFAPPPYTAPAPIALGWYLTPAGQHLDFDAYIAVCRARGAEPFVVVPCESPANSGATWDEQLEHAVGWVRYARDRGYGVRYWEIGNENWHNDTGPAVEMAEHVLRVARAMRAVDPDIRLAASGNNRAWWDAFLPIAASELDVLTVSVYNCWDWKGYERFLRAPEPDLLAGAAAALNAIDALPDAKNRERLRVIVSETNSVDYAEGGWPKTNTLGHALVTFESLGRMLSEPRITAALLWNTRWVDDSEAPTNQFYALNATNDLLPAGQAVGLWGRHLRGDLLAVTGTAGHLRAHACVDGAGTWTVWLVNRGLEPVPAVRVAVHGLRANAVAAHRFHGAHPDDAEPVLTAATPIPVVDGVLSALTCPPLSITVVTGG